MALSRYDRYGPVMRYGGAGAAAAAAIAFNQGMELAERMSGHVRRFSEFMPDVPGGRRLRPARPPTFGTPGHPPSNRFLPWLLRRRRRRFPRRF